MIESKYKELEIEKLNSQIQIQRTSYQQAMEMIAKANPAESVSEKTRYTDSKKRLIRIG